MNANEMLAKLNAKYSNSEITRRANAGQWAEAAEAAAGMLWGIWAECRQIAGLPSDEAARNEWLAAHNARRAARFNKRYPPQPPNNMNNYSEYTVRLSTEPSYYGSECTQQDAERIVDSLGSLIRAEFHGIQIERYTDGQGSSKTAGPDDSVVEQIDRWIESNWTAAL